MGFFHYKFGIKPIIEADIDGQSGDDASTDYTSDDSSNTPPPAEGGEETTDYTEQPDDNSQDQNTDQQSDDNQPSDDTAEGGEETTDYTDMDDEGGEGSPEETEGGSESAPTQDSETPVDDLKQQEEEMYGLSTEKLEIRHKELKKQYLELYDTTVSILDRIGSASVQEEDIGVIEYVSSTLSNFRTMITDYIDKVYPLNSYIENSVNYNRFLAVLQGINKILEDLAKKDNK